MWRSPELGNDGILHDGRRETLHPREQQDADCCQSTTGGVGRVTTLFPTSYTFSSKSSSPANVPCLPSLPALLTSFHSCLLHLQHVTMFSVTCPFLTDMPVGMCPSFLIPFLLILGINLRSRSFMYNDHLPPL